MEYILFTIVAVALYFFASWILERIEIARGARYEYRSLIFFGILLVLAFGIFALMRNLLTP